MKHPGIIVIAICQLVKQGDKKMAIYVQIDGINGNVTAAGHEKWIEAHSMSFGLGRAIGGGRPGSVKDRESSIPSLSEIVITKTMDETSPLLFIESCIGIAKPVVIHFCRTGDQTQTYMEYTLSNVLISSYEVSGSGDSIPSEKLSFNYDKIEVKYTPYDDNHKPGSPIPAGYDLKTAKKV